MTNGQFELVLPEHEVFMREALTLAERAAEIGEVPVGCVVVREGVVIGRGFNVRERENDAAAHAEIMAIREAGRHLRDWRLTGCHLYVTLEPCPMCAGAILSARIAKLYYGARDARVGAVISRLSLFEYGMDTGPAVYGGLLARESARLLAGFFEKRRAESSRCDRDAETCAGSE